jgi:3-phenylpropionate/trans-cinnamate dioxygenase ferredoxin reductase component
MDAAPNVGLAEATGLDLRPAAQGGGVVVDGALATSHPDVFAAGDIASIPSPHYGRPLRVEELIRSRRKVPTAELEGFVG